MSWIVGDVETSGLGPEAKIVEVALAHVDDAMNIIESAHSLIDPQTPINPAASGIHGITNAHVAGKPTIEEFFAGEGAYFADDGDLPLIAHNAKFDMAFLSPHMKALTSTLDTLKLARIIYPEAENHKLQTLRYYLGLDGGSAHSALGDVEVLLSLLRHMCSQSNLDLYGLYKLSQQPILLTKMPFGKHKGTDLNKLPNNYVKWLIGLPDLDENLRYSLEVTFN